MNPQTPPAPAAKIRMTSLISTKEDIIMAYNPTDNAKIKDVISLAQYSSAKIAEEIENIDLPTASTTTKGAVKIGEGLNITDDVLSTNPVPSLDTVPSSANGGLWYEIISNTVVLKMYYNNNEYYLTLSKA